MICMKVYIKKSSLLKYISLLISLLILVTPLGSIGSFVVTAQSSSSTLYIAWINPTPYESLSTYNPNIFAGGLGGSFYGIAYAYSTILNVSNNVMLPGLIENWSFSPSNWEQVWQKEPINVTLYVRHNTGWGDGTPVTAYDIMATDLILQASYLNPNPVKYTIINNYTLTLTFAPDCLSPYLMPYTLRYTAGLTQVATIIPYQEWKPVINEILGNLSAIRSQNTTVIDHFREIIHSYLPSGPLSGNYNGPFYLSQITPNELILNKNPYYYASNEIKWNKVIIYQYTSESPALAAIKSGEVSLVYSGELSLSSQVLSSLPSYYKVIDVNQPFGWGLYFNLQNPWVSNLKVRQAIAYVLNRTAISLAGGIKYSPVSVPNGIPSFPAYKEFITPAVSNLNTYSVNLTKAQRLMESAGFTIKNGQWYAPNGTPLSFTILYGGPITPGISNMLDVIDSELSSFGIPTHYIDITSLTQLHNTYKSGAYTMDFGNWGGYFPGTIDWYLPLFYFGGYPFNVTHWNQIVTLPNGTTVNLHELGFLSTAPNSTSQLIDVNNEIAYTMNYYLPVLPLVKEDYVIVINTNQVSNIPTNNSWIWSEALYGVGGNAFLQEGFYYGYFEPIIHTTVPPTTTTTSSTSVIYIAGVIIAIIIIAGVIFLLRKRH